MRRDGTAKPGRSARRQLPIRRNARPELGLTPSMPPKRRIRRNSRRVAEEEVPDARKRIVRKAHAEKLEESCAAASAQQRRRGVRALRLAYAADEAPPSATAKFHHARSHPQDAPIAAVHSANARGRPRPSFRSPVLTL